jgi:site-specific recombinase XerD
MEYMNLPEAINAFIAINRNHLAERTIDGYERSLAAFCGWLEENAAGCLADYYAHFATEELAKLHDQVSPVAGLTNGNDDNGANEGQNGAENDS